MLRAVDHDPKAVAVQRERLRTGRTVMAVALAEGGPVGIGSHQPVGEVTDIVGVAVLPASRRRGIAAALTSLLTQDSLKRGIKTVFYLPVMSQSLAYMVGSGSANSRGHVRPCGCRRAPKHAFDVSATVRCASDSRRGCNILKSSGTDQRVPDQSSSADLTCQQLVELVSDYLENALPPTDRARFEAHLGFCPGCETYLEQMRLTVRSLGRLTEDTIEPGARDQLLEIFRQWNRGD